MKKDTIDYIKNKSFVELSAKEKEEMKDVFTTESEFNRVKAMFIQVENISSTSFRPSERVKKNLDEVFMQKYPASKLNSFFALIVPKSKPFYRQPLVQIAAVILLLLLIVPMFNSSLVKETIKVAELNKKEDVEVVKNLEIENDAPADVVKDTSEKAEMKNAVLPVKKESKLMPNKPKSSFREKEATPTTIELQEPVPSVSIEMNQNPMFEHPDGIYKGEMEEVNFISISVDEQVELLDVLTVTF